MTIIFKTRCSLVPSILVMIANRKYKQYSTCTLEQNYELFENLMTLNCVIAVAYYFFSNQAVIAAICMYHSLSLLKTFFHHVFSKNIDKQFCYSMNMIIVLSLHTCSLQTVCLTKKWSYFNCFSSIICYVTTLFQYLSKS